MNETVEVWLGDPLCDGGIFFKLRRWDAEATATLVQKGFTLTDFYQTVFDLMMSGF